ncbi:CPBP family intramembrane glutamic endopeptidase [Dyella tabacisoli]|uniref:CPBP family intramembrane metalloprotease n=1 Tax=Dyella tabacisoli TaxID=2282381 RepID=A0A369UI48_9GAMM|nr:type II CAAX endopeptidase family protein [Dyella tabacisoli]RDD80167.1 CPBP family intramembrane metalloprotease [Dyella tabacisoli]
MKVIATKQVSRLRGALHVVAFAAAVLGTFIAVSTLLRVFGVHFHSSGPEEYPVSIVGTFILALIVLAATALMSRLEHVSVLDYGLRDRSAFRRAVMGAATGFLAIAALVLGLWGTGSLTLHVVAQPVSSAVLYAVIWAAGYGLVALAEEMLFRGYPLATLSRVIGAQGAAIVTSLVFGLLHLGNSGESRIAAINGVLLALVFAASVYRTGSLWWAIGFHAAWNWGESWLFGAADSGILAAGRLLEATPRGNDWLSGGTAGPEGSVGMIVVIAMAALSLYGMRRRLQDTAK